MAKETYIDEAKLNQILDNIRMKGLQKVGAFLESDIKKSFKPGTGRTYTRGNITHTASAPGEPPAVDTGRLRASISFHTYTNYVDVGTNVEYAAPLEFGTSKMAARPFLRPALQRNQREIVRVFIEGAK